MQHHIVPLKKTGLGLLYRRGLSTLAQGVAEGELLSDMKDIFAEQEVLVSVFETCSKCIKCVVQQTCQLHIDMLKHLRLENKVVSAVSDFQELKPAIPLSSRLRRKEEWTLSLRLRLANHIVFQTCYKY